MKKVDHRLTKSQERILNSLVCQRNWTSIFMGKDLSSLGAEQKRFRRIFNSNLQMFEYHLPDEDLK